MTGLLIHHGTDVPPLEWSGGLTDVDVVLAAYHPLVKYGGYAERFPHARRWVYVNPTSADPWVLERTDAPPPLTGYDQRWGLPRLDLTRSAAVDWAVAAAVEAFEADGASSHGLFVDDLDRLLPGEATTAMTFVERVEAATSREPRWFLNRAFALWPLVEPLDAVLLEDLAPTVARHAPVDEVRWLRDVVLPALRAVRERGVTTHAFSYADQVPTFTTAPDLELDRDLAALLDSVTVGASRTINDWKVA